MLLAYAIVGARPRLSGPGGRVAPILVGGGPYLLGLEAADGPRPDLNALRAHHAVVAAAATEVPCLPCRFGTAFADAAGARAWLDARREPLVEGLARVAGRCEFDLRAPRPARDGAAEAEGGPGTRYLAGLRARYASSDPAPLRELADAARRRFPTSVVDVAVDEASLMVALLVERAGAADFAQVAGEWRPGPGWRWSGPWPAYTFAATWIGSTA